MIETVKIQGDGYLVNGTMSVPKADGNKDYESVKKFIANGGVVGAEFSQAQLKEKEQASFRVVRDAELAAIDIKLNIAQDTSNGNVTELRKYRQALRDATIEWVMPTREEYGVL